MKNLISLILSILFPIIVFGQANNPAPNGFANVNEFKQNAPTLTFDFQIRKRTRGDVFMSGGIENYELEKIKAQSDIDKLENEVWGVRISDATYINSFPYSKVSGYNLILEKGYYTYFIGEPARKEKEQRELGIVKPDEKQIKVCCQAGYVILPDASIKLLRPELLLELCKDNEELSKEIIAAKLKLGDVLKMFDFLKRYNATKI